jgi:hypothetical protein
MDEPISGIPFRTSYTQRSSI